jgi:hypothetical protein
MEIYVYKRTICFYSVIVYVIFVNIYLMYKALGTSHAHHADPFVVRNFSSNSIVVVVVVVVAAAVVVVMKSEYGW